MLWQGSGELDALPYPAQHGPEAEQRGAPHQQRGYHGGRGAGRPSTNVTAPKPVSLVLHSMTLSNRPLRVVKRMGQLLMGPKLAV